MGGAVPRQVGLGFLREVNLSQQAGKPPPSVVSVSRSISEQLGEGNYNRNILYEKTPFSIKGEKKKKRSVVAGPKLRGKELA